MAFSPLGGPGALIPGSTRDACADIGKRVGASGAAVALRWLVQQDVAFSVHSRGASHLREDLDVFRFELAPSEMATLEALSESPALYWDSKRS